MHIHTNTLVDIDTYTYTYIRVYIHEHILTYIQTHRHTQINSMKLSYVHAVHLYVRILKPQVTKMFREFTNTLIRQSDLHLQEDED